METKILLDKTGWPEGPWQKESDWALWEHSGYPCYVRRHPHLGHLCGYVRLPEGHPWIDDEDARNAADAHGGITFCGTLQGDGVPAGTWVGFDCAHLGDVIPRLLHYAPSALFGMYREFDLVVTMTESLALDARAVVSDAER